MNNDIPRRRRLHLMTPAELAIQEAVALVDKLPASPAATAVLNRLHEAQDLVADIVDDCVDTRPMTFSGALQSLNRGQRMARAGWNGKDMFVFLVHGSSFIVNREPLKSILGEGSVVHYRAHIDLKDAEGKIVVWTPSQTDLMACDWVVVK